MNLSTVRAPKKASEKRKRVGRGMGSGMGKTSTRGSRHVSSLHRKGVRSWVRPWSAERAAGGITRPIRHNRQPYAGINVLYSGTVAAAIEDVLRSSPDRLRDQGLQRAARFTWKATADATLDVYREVADQRRRRSS